jgi:hypothetical protein
LEDRGIQEIPNMVIKHGQVENPWKLKFPTNDWYMDVLMDILMGKNIFKWMIFPHATFDYRRVTMAMTKLIQIGYMRYHILPNGIMRRFSSNRYVSQHVFPMVSPWSTTWMRNWDPDDNRNHRWFAMIGCIELLLGNGLS